MSSHLRISFTHGRWRKLRKLRLGSYVNKPISHNLAQKNSSKHWYLLMTTLSLGISHSSKVRMQEGVRSPRARIRSSVCFIRESYLEESKKKIIVNSGFIKSVPFSNWSDNFEFGNLGVKFLVVFVSNVWSKKGITPMGQH